MPKRNISKKNINTYKWIINIIAGMLLFYQLLWLVVLGTGTVAIMDPTGPLFIVMKISLVALFIFILYGVNTNMIIIKNKISLIFLISFLILFSIFCNYETFVLIFARTR